MGANIEFRMVYLRDSLRYNVFFGFKEDVWVNLIYKVFGKLEEVMSLLILIFANVVLM